MTRFSLCLLGVLAMSTPALAQVAITTGPTVTESATQIRTQGTGPQLFAQQIGKTQLHDMLRRILANNQAVIVMAHDYGKPNVSNALDREIERAAAPYQNQWNSNLAASYDGLLSTPEWAQIISKKPTPETQAKLSQAMITAGQRMQIKSQPIVQAAANEALGKMRAKFPAKNPAVPYAVTPAAPAY